MAAPNDVEITRVYTREVGGNTADIAFDESGQYEVVVEAEAGTTILGSGAPYELGLTVRNLTDSNADAQPNHEINSGTLGAGAWVNNSIEQVFGPFSHVPGNASTGAHMYEAIAYVRARSIDPDVSFAKSPMFITYDQAQ